jgi:hypothetical protein
MLSFIVQVEFLEAVFFPFSYLTAVTAAITSAAPFVFVSGNAR